MAGVARPGLVVEIDFGTGALTAPGTWTDVSAFVIGQVQYSWGRDKAVDDFQPGRGSFRLDNRDGRFDPSNSSGPYYGQLKARRKVRVRAQVSNSGILDQTGAAILDETGAPILSESVDGVTIASGWIEGWPLTPVGRKLVYVDITFVDFLAVAARLPMPMSVYDYQIAKTAPYAWYRMNDTTSTAVDASGHGRDGTWRVFEGYEAARQGLLMTQTVLQSGSTDPIIPGSGRPARSWASMQAEVGQPLGAFVGTPRTPVLVTHQDTAALLGGDWSLEFWVLPRSAYPLDVTNSYSTTTPMEQPIVTWGDPAPDGLYGGTRYEFGLGDGLSPFEVPFPPTLSVYLSPSWQFTAFYPALTERVQHQIVFVYDAATNSIQEYVDGTITSGGGLNSLVGSGGFSPSLRQGAVVGYANGRPRGLQSVMGDVVFWDRKLAGAEVLLNWRAGRYANLEPAGSADLQINDALAHALEMVAATGIEFANDSTSTEQTILPAELTGKTLADYLHVVVASEQGVLYWDPTGGDWGRLEYRGRNWPVSDPEASTSQITLSDAGGASDGYGEITYRDGSDQLANDVTVRFTGGEQRATNSASIADYGPSTGSVETLLISREQALQVAEWRAWKFGTAPSTTIVPDRIVVEPTNDDEFGFAARARPCQRFTLLRTRPDGTTISVDYWVDGISHQIDVEAGGAWVTTLTVSPADYPARPFQFDISLIGSSDVLWI